MSKTPKTTKDQLVTYEVRSNGKTIDPSYINEISIEMAVNHISSATIHLVESQLASQTSPVHGANLLLPGTKIEILAGYSQQNNLLFSGIVTSQTIKVGIATGPLLVVTAKDESVKMTVGRKNASYVNMRDSDVISQLIGKYGLTADVASTSVQIPETIQYYATDWDFMVARADVNGMVVTNALGKVKVLRPEATTEAELSLTYGMDIFSFEGDLDATHQYGHVQSSAWDYSRQQVITATSATRDSGEGDLSSKTLSDVIGLQNYGLQTSASLGQKELTAWAKAMTTKSEFAKIRGALTFAGTELARVGGFIQINGFGGRFDGRGFVSGVTHLIRQGSWETSAQLGLSAEWFTASVKTEAPLASGLLPGIQGLQTGVVKQVTDDPEGQFRVKVGLPLVHSGSEGIWARLATFYASNGAGAFFYPEVDDEVIIGFLNDDPSSAIILGSLYSSGRPAPLTPNEQNNVKSIVTGKKMKIAFDESKGEITINTPSENQLVISDEDKGIRLRDQNDNRVSMSPDGIEMKSPTSIYIESEQSVHIKGQTGVRLESPAGDVALNGLNIAATADIQLSAASSMQTKVSGETSLSLESAAISINGNNWPKGGG